MPRQLHTSSRRQFIRTVLGATAGGGVALALGSTRLLAASTDPASRTGSRRREPSYFGAGLPTHLAWVWQFRHDGSRDEIRDVLASHGLGIVLKTHDGPDWMSRYDHTDDAITGPRKVEEMAAFFENGGVPFHCWCVVHGSNAAREAEMAADVLSAGARSLTMDLEPHGGFWRGTPQDAADFGAALRWRAPNASLITSLDPRPWYLGDVPLAEFAGFSDALAPQVYWHAFSTPTNVERYRRAGYDPGEGGVTPRFVLDVTMEHLVQYERPVTPVGDGTSPDLDAWREFIDGSYAHDLDAVAVWRFGVASPELWEVLRDTPPRISVYTVAPGDTLSSIARKTGTDVHSLIEVNGLTNPDFLSVGQQLRLPRGARTSTPGPAASEASPGGGAYTVQPGDTLWSLSSRWGTTPDVIAQLNGIADPSRIRIGQSLRVP